MPQSQILYKDIIVELFKSSMPFSLYNTMDMTDGDFMLHGHKATHLLAIHASTKIELSP